VSAFKGKTLTIETVTTTGHKALDAIKQADDVPDAEKLYREKHRPLFHFTSRRGWLNDPNGLVFVPDRENNPWGQNGEWHLFYQHNPFGREWGNMHWGHAVSSDLFHWKELGEALYPKKYGDWAFSGSAVADNGNTSGWGMKDKPPLVLAYTSTGRGECIAYSTDKGRTWTEYDKNPVVKHSGRDPKLVWYEKGKHWVMAVYDEFGKKQWIAFYTSPDLKTWTFASRVEGFFECPDLFELPVCGHGFGERLAKWVLYAADGKYVVGEFDGKTFKPDHTGKKQLWYGNFYAAQTFDNSPGRRPQDLPFDAKRIQIGWAQGATFPGMPFNQQMTVPVHLMLWKGQDPVDPDEIRLTANPVEQLWGLRERPPAFDLQGGQRQVVAKPTTLADRVDAFDATLSIELGQAKGFTLDLRGTKLVYVGTKHTLSCKNVTAPAKPHNDVVILRILVDRGSVEVFADESRVAMSVAAIPDEKNRALGLTPHDGEVTVRSATVYRLKSAWEK
jgi:fructan beta-fructosidase